MALDRAGALAGALAAVPRCGLLQRGDASMAADLSLIEKSATDIVKLLKAGEVTPQKVAPAGQDA